ncbi:CHAD domain-containing protein [Myxococcus sp. K38C18041901]|uniref:CHAD domain-containing protein n=1 Tax=Myxococcus guangdongensis TaxID=2906760 RepID=UPI0020A6FF4D|nr:CHAD domain-containing protein [Myxococcus guangdongensis]MCP3058801.1 CHAD domain-containing protein [Myxococcus guangdongensis]
MAQPTPIRGLGPDSELGQAARRILAGRLADVRKPESKLNGTIDDDAVHDMRVATRRLRAALQVFRPLGGLTKLEHEVKRLQDALGDVRDLHVQALWLEDVAKKARREKPQTRKGIAALGKAQLSGLAPKEKRLRSELKRWAARTLPRMLRKVDGLEDDHRFGGRRVKEPLHWRVRRVHKRMKVYMDAPDAVSAHVLRKELKKLRYELEIFQPAFRRTLGALTEMLVPLQEGLGELHDADVRLEVFERLAAGGKPQERKAARALLPLIREGRAKRSAEIARELQRWHAEDIPKRLLQVLS